MRKLRVMLDKLQDTEDKKHNKHVEIPLTVAKLAEIIYQVEITAQKKEDV